MNNMLVLPRAEPQLGTVTPQIWLDDVMDRFQAMPDQSVQLVLMDPPYGVTNADWDTPVDMAALQPEVQRVLRPDGAAVIHSQGMFTARLMVQWERKIGRSGRPVKSKFWKYNYVWVKTGKPTNWLNSKHQPLRQFEDVCVFSAGRSKFNPAYTYGHPPLNARVSAKRTRRRAEVYNDFDDTPVPEGTATRRCPTNVIRIDPPEFHYVLDIAPPKFSVFEVQKPVALAEYLIRAYTDPGDVVFDPTMGSGTALVAGARLGRLVVGGDDQYSQLCLTSMRLSAEAGVVPDVPQGYVIDDDETLRSLENAESYVRALVNGNAA